MRANLNLYLKRAAELPPHVAAAKAARLALRQVRHARELRQDLGRPTYITDGASQLVQRIRLSMSEVPLEWGRTIRPLCDRYLAHEFDLLGSGWVRVQHGLHAAGVEGHAYPPAPRLEADAEGRWLAERVSKANLPQSQRLWRMIDGAYRPIDWQIDFKTGYRWDERSHFRRLSYGRHAGADVKVPWELARLQHLPQLAVAHLLARGGQPGWRAPDAYAREVRNQILDFLATNPPRFGVNWLCPMDVGIRAANMLLAVDLLRAGGWILDEPFERAVALAALAHGRHLAANLEWSTTPRSNHYLANLAGLLFSAAYLPATAETGVWLEFGAQQLSKEILCQFLADGGNFEGSTSYHRLSLEIVLFAAALLVGQAGEQRSTVAKWPEWCAHIAAETSPSGANGATSIDGQHVPLARAAVERLALALGVVSQWMKPNGCPPQIGDNDSGRLFRLHPSLEKGTDGEIDNLLDHRHIVDAGASLFAAELPSGGPRWLDASVVRALARGRALRRNADASKHQDRLGDEASFHRVSEEIARSDPASRRIIELSLPGLDPSSLRRHALTAFGLYIFAAGETFISLRCPPRPPFPHTMGHTHDDNLCLEVHHRGADLIADPGSYVYTPLPERRDLYRGAAAHFAPRPAKGAPAASMRGPFAMEHDSIARCVYFGPLGAGAILEGPGWLTYRVLRLEPGKLVIIDACSNGALAPLSGIPLSKGYGRLDRASSSVVEAVTAGTTYSASVS